ncbi:hypothetical protein GQ43DRAFT_447268 [Delitschia confertaspora ATCC 74209]|uniref:Heterokaryon incompatibility domain-containing protein n=1 Tax=Delitschia confertaspora ATCC 74209 TaxID=1513339 RepID=A0A9P4MUG8_9PLEO|nr:hypothetical protein GQ43DRAFT_447268 [Delitschia confertaspora ATCC 74209]
MRFNSEGNEDDIRQAIEYLESAKQIHDSLKLRINEISAPCILDLPYDSIGGRSISLAHAPPCRFRFIHCRPLVAKSALRVFEFESLPMGRYAPISYVWRGLGADPNHNPKEFFSVTGATNADPLSLNILRLACIAALQNHVELLWLDGLCILQESKEDKDWQIQRMYNVYRHCALCLIIPGGMTRLATLETPTSWIHRAWTLQEVMGPKESRVLFAWQYGTCILQTFFPVRIEDLSPGEAGTAEFMRLLQMSGKRPNVREDPNHKPLVPLPDGTLEIKLLSNGDYFQRNSLIGALDTLKEGRHANSVWRSAMVRAAFRPVDKILSIMGVLNVRLNPANYPTLDWKQAAIDLMRACLEGGGKADWLAIAPELGVNPEICTLPNFPATGEKGIAVVVTEDGEKSVGGVVRSYVEGWELVGAPGGSMTEDGYLTLWGSVANLQKCDGSGDVDGLVGGFQCVGKERYAVVPKYGVDNGFYALYVGRKVQYTNGAIPRWIDPNDHIVMIVERKGEGKWWTVDYAFVTEELCRREEWYQDNVTLG